MTTEPTPLTEIQKLAARVEELERQVMRQEDMRSVAEEIVGEAHKSLATRRARGDVPTAVRMHPDDWEVVKEHYILPEKRSRSGLPLFGLPVILDERTLRRRPKVDG